MRKLNRCRGCLDVVESGWLRESVWLKQTKNEFTWHSSYKLGKVMNTSKMHLFTNSHLHLSRLFAASVAFWSQPWFRILSQAKSLRKTVSVSTAQCAGCLPWRGARGSDCVPVSCRHPVKNVTAGNEMAAPGHHGPLFSTEIEHKLHPGSHDGSPNVRFQYHFLSTVASEKINKEYVCKYKYIQRRQNVSDRAVNDNAVGSHVECAFIPLEGNDRYPSWHFAAAHPQSTTVRLGCMYMCVSYYSVRSKHNMPSRSTLFSLSHKINQLQQALESFKMKHRQFSIKCFW